ncbi:MAG: pilus assembly protein [Acetobacteraceae bacterium]|nr:pilus assembly protein [Acetobacteraceae bacterium]
MAGRKWVTGFRSRVGKAWRQGRGQAVVELALLLPVLLLVLLGIAEVGRLVAVDLALQHAAREGARLGATGASDAEITQRVLDSAVLLDPALLTVSITPPEASREHGVALTVTVQYPFELMVPLMSDLVGEVLSLQSTLSMRME